MNFRVFGMSPFYVNDSVYSTWHRFYMEVCVKIDNLCLIKFIHLNRYFSGGEKALTFCPKELAWLISLICFNLHSVIGNGA